MNEGHVEKCQYCGTVVPSISLSAGDFERMIIALRNGSKTLAAAEVQHAAQSEKSKAQAWVEHLLSCIYAWPFSETDQAILRHIDNAFKDIEKPEHFTDYTHCGECKEHDETLRRRVRETLQRKDLGNPGWDPVTFCSAEGVAYLFPALARFALAPDIWRTNDWYVGQFLSHLTWEGNGFLLGCSDKQRQAVYDLLEHLTSSRCELAANPTYNNELEAAKSCWRASRA